VPGISKATFLMSSTVWNSPRGATMISRCPVSMLPPGRIKFWETRASRMTEIEKPSCASLAVENSIQIVSFWTP
jgi:hypothetical protein